MNTKVINQPLGKVEHLCQRLLDMVEFAEVFINGKGLPVDAETGGAVGAGFQVEVRTGI